MYDWPENPGNTLMTKTMSTSAANELAYLVFVLQGLHMNGNPIGARIQVPVKLLKRVGDHKMHIERNLRDLLQLGNEGDAQRKVGHKMAIHHIDVDEIGASTLEHADIMFEVHEIRRQNGRRNLDVTEHGEPLSLKTV